MTKFIIAAVGLCIMAGFAYAGTKPTPGPLLGIVAGPWGLVASVVGYGAYRVVKARRA